MHIKIYIIAITTTLESMHTTTRSRVLSLAMDSITNVVVRAYSYY